MQQMPFPMQADNAHTLHVQVPTGPARGVVLLLHGMAEHAARYEELQLYLAQQGYVAACYNHRGHGPEVPNEQLGYFADSQGWSHLVSDAEVARQALAALHPDMPFILLGHSMGSFIAREYALRYPEKLDALILSGTGWHPWPLCALGGIIARITCALGGKRKPAGLLHYMAFSSHNKAFVPARTPVDWLSRDEQEVDLYMADPLCGFAMTGGAYCDLFSGLRDLTKLKRLKAMPSALPVLIISGQEDPVGGAGKGPTEIARQYEAAGLTRVTLQLYQGARHELFHEINRAQVMDDLAGWLDSALREPVRRE